MKEGCRTTCAIMHAEAHTVDMTKIDKTALVDNTKQEDKEEEEKRSRLPVSLPEPDITLRIVIGARAME